MLKKSKYSANYCKYKVKIFYENDLAVFFLNLIQNHGFFAYLALSFLVQKKLRYGSRSKTAVNASLFKFNFQHKYG